MTKKSRIWIGISALLMLSAYFLPLWQILLEAPQYPEGLFLKIWLDGITGNIDQINGLNHYIGMKFIVVEDFIEFKILPYLYGAIVLMGIITALTGRRKLLYIWFVVLILFAIVAFADFYLWEYNYGHNLDPKAAIKVPGMTYQPPLFGWKQLLNFLAGSLPDTGGIIVGVAGVIITAVVIYEYRLTRRLKAQ
jgi:copper chaperone NosL